MTAAQPTTLVRCADRFQHANLGHLLKDLNLEESADHQDADEQCKSTLGLHSSLLGGISGNIIDGRRDIRHFNV